MADIHKLSERMIDFAERISNVADAAQGKRMERRSNGLSQQIIDAGERLSNVSDAAKGKGRRGAIGTTRWVLLPAAGASLYALAKSEFFARQAKGVVDEAKTRASELPNDLMNSVRQTTQKSPSRTASRSGSRRRNQNSSARKTKPGR